VSECPKFLELYAPANKRMRRTEEIVTDDKSVITGHFIAHWGVPDDIRPRALPGVGEFAILQFPPRGTRRTWRYATNGMSTYLQADPEVGIKVRTELYASSKERVRWVDELLAALAVYPKDQSTYFAEGDTIDVGQPIDRASSDYTAVLLAPPGPLDPSTVGIVGGARENILVHQVIGLLPGEAETVTSEGSKIFWERLAAGGEVVLDQRRRSK
jgi:hypothetical protein